MTASCPSGLCLSASLLLVTSRARLESDVLEPQPGVTAGHCCMFQVWEFRTDLLRSLMTSLSRLVFVFRLRLLGSQALRPLFHLDYCWLPLWLSWSLPLPLVTSQARLESDILNPPTWCNCWHSPYVPGSGRSGQVSCGPFCLPLVS